LNQEEENYASITSEEIQQTAQTYFTENNSVSLHYLMNEAKA
jgi:hypothetical protein